uniref:Uncharacterized protein n=1 Tax=Nelumbo nucifera TaxID=4432 RepID=A0A822ZKU7_NELNU|nr:TPA_asm: hypothetical protein HUJ06_004022 [Nelumbo nucifera]
MPPSAEIAIATPPPEGTEASFSLPKVMNSMMSFPLILVRRSSILLSSTPARLIPRWF